jgi:hypothetical protein
MFFVPLRRFKRITTRQQFNEATGEIINSSNKLDNLYIMSPSLAEWYFKWPGTKNNSKQIKILVNRDVYELQDALHFENSKSNLLNAVKEEIRARQRVMYGLNMAFTESGNKITGKAIVFYRYGKSSSFSAVFIDETDQNADGSDISNLKKFFDYMFINEGKTLKDTDADLAKAKAQQNSTQK